MPTNNIKPTTERAKHTLDATDQILGRLATQAAGLLRGKQKTSFTAHIDGGDYVTITNAQAIKVTGNKLQDKVYSTHSGYIGNLKQVTMETLMKTTPEKVIEMAIYGMLPKNRLRAGWMRRLRVYSGNGPQA